MGVHAMRLCIDCASYDGVKPAEWTGMDTIRLAKDVCKDPRNDFVDFVDGHSKTYDCSWLRNLNDPNKCGPEGRWWKEKQ
jgi:hypothetical protein